MEKTVLGISSRYDSDGVCGLEVSRMLVAWAVLGLVIRSCALLDNCLSARYVRDVCDVMW